MPYKWYDVREMYDDAKSNARPLLSSYDKAFWSEYILNYARYDKLFRNMYKSFRYYDQNPFDNTTIGDITDEFIDAVYLHLMANDKKYSELFKLYQLNDQNMLNDFYVEEITSGGKTTNGSYVGGSRTDTTEDVYGAKSGVQENKIAAFNSTDYVKNNKTEYSDDTYTDTGQYVKGSQTDTEHREEVANNTTTTRGFKDNPSKNAREFIKTWNSYEFYLYIFKQIAKELLLV